MQSISVALAGGLGLAAYHAGVLTELSRAGFRIDAISGSSAGAIAAVLVAGNEIESLDDRFKQFWNLAGVQSMPGAQNSLGTRIFGATGIFRPRLPIENIMRFRSFYDLSPLRITLECLVDFTLLNSGRGPRVCIAGTDIETGDPVFFDTAAGTRIEPIHILASCGLLPEFEPVSIGGRLVGDGGLSCNVPFEPLITVPMKGPLVVVDLFPRDGSAPLTAFDALKRKNDLIYSNQTYGRLKAVSPRFTEQVVHLSYRPAGTDDHEEKLYDFSAGAVKKRWEAGGVDARKAIEVLRSGVLGLTSIR